MKLNLMQKKTLVYLDIKSLTNAFKVTLQKYDTFLNNILT